jgi:hypothetical protein
MFKVQLPRGIGRPQDASVVLIRLDNFLDSVGKRGSLVAHN